jgi:hypothetical protein
MATFSFNALEYSDDDLTVLVCEMFGEVNRKLESNIFCQTC